MPIVSVNGLKTFYESKGKGRALVLIHGAGGSSGYWTNQLSGLSGNLRVIAIDLPGHGASERPKGKISIELYAEHVVSFLRQIRVGRSIVVGHSMSGLVVQQLALEHPDLIEKLIIVDSGAMLPIPQGYTSVGRSQPMKVLMELFAMSLSEKTLSKNSLASILEQVQGTSTYDPEIIFDDLEAAAGLDLRERIREITVPTLIIVGSDSMIPRKMADFIHDNIKGSRLEVIADAGHLLMIEKPDEFNKVILNFAGT